MHFNNLIYYSLFYLRKKQPCRLSRRVTKFQISKFNLLFSSKFNKKKEVNAMLVQYNNERTCFFIQKKIMSSNQHNNTNMVLLIKENMKSPLAEEISVNKAEHSFFSPRYKKDFYNICFLMFLYLLQGVPIGLLYSLPFILSSR